MRFLLVFCALAGITEDVIGSRGAACRSPKLGPFATDLTNGNRLALPVHLM
jgi:hypothetical protein